MTEDEMVGWHKGLDGHEFEQALRVGDGQEAWSAAVRGVARSRDTGIRLSDWNECELGTLERGNVFSFKYYAYTKENIEESIQGEK